MSDVDIALTVLENELAEYKRTCRTVHLSQAARALDELRRLTGSRRVTTIRGATIH